MTNKYMNNFVFVLNKINQYGSTGSKYKETIGVYDNEIELNKQIDYYHKHNPSTKDNSYHFEMMQIQMNQIGDITHSIVTIR